MLRRSGHGLQEAGGRDQHQHAGARKDAQKP
jgi:hypothetical protein